MRGKANALGHSIHPMLIVFPLGILPLVPIWDIVHFASDNPFWARMAFWCLVAGGGGALLAAVPGFLDWLSIPKDTRAKRIGAIHALVNLAAVGLFLASFIVRLDERIVGAGAGAFVLALLGVLVAMVGGWFGGELVERLGMSVHEEANLDAPSSVAHLGAMAPRRLRPTEPTPA